MILKRRQPKPPGIGSICMIKSKVLDKMVNQDSYLENSAPYIEEVEGKKIGRRSIRKNRGSNNKIMCADQLLLYVAGSSPFKGIIEAIPLVIRCDSGTGTGVRHLLDEKKTFLMRMDSLSIPSEQTLIDARDSYGSTAQSYIEKVIQSESHYNKPQFSWESR
tara:strand:+ start:60118 stop:60603 length:486 start_codon:yes stop_codon:yes gene_type:complete